MLEGFEWRSGILRELLWLFFQKKLKGSKEKAMAVFQRHSNEDPDEWQPWEQ